MQLIELTDGELLEGIATQAKALGISAGAIVSIVGAVDAFTISTMPTHDATKDVVTTYDVPAELTGSGEIVDGRPHVHAVMAVEGDRAVAGHLHRAVIGTWFAHVYVAELA